MAFAVLNVVWFWVYFLFTFFSIFFHFSFTFFHKLFIFNLEQDKEERMKLVKDEMKMIRKENIDNFLVTDQEIKQRESERRAKQKALHHVWDQARDSGYPF